MIRDRVLADGESGPDRAVRAPTGHEAENVGLAGRKLAVGAAADGFAGATDCSNAGQKRGEAALLRKNIRLLEERLRVRVLSCRCQHSAVLVVPAGEPGRRTGPTVELMSCDEVPLRPLTVAERRSEHPEIAVGRTVERDAVADHDVVSLVRGELGVDERRDVAVANRSTRVREVRQRAQPEALTKTLEPLTTNALELMCRLLLESELGEQGGERRTPKSAAGVARSESARRRQRAPRASPAHA